MIDKPGQEGSVPDAVSPKAASPPKRPRTKRGLIRAVTVRFVQEIDSLADTLPLAMNSIGDAHKQALANLEQFVATNAKARDEAEGTIDIHANDILRFQALSKSASRTAAAHVLVPRSFVVALVSQYDAFLGRLIEAFLVIRPEVLNGSDKALTFSDLVAFPSIDAARDHIIEKEVESVLRKSHSEQFDWLEGKFKLKLRHDLAVWPQFIELTERRNLFVHTGGKVSAQYIENCGEHGVDCKDVQRGQVLAVTPAYFRHAYEAMYEIGVKLAHVFWRKLRPEERDRADGHLVEITYELLAEGKFKIAQALLDFAVEVLKDHASADHRLRFVINRIQAYKWAGDSVRARELLDKEDFSALSDQYQLADAVLRDDFVKAVALVNRIGKSGVITLGDYREWPLFQTLRKQAEFENAVLEVFGEALNRVVVQPIQSDTVESAEEVDDAEEVGDEGESSVTGGKHTPVEQPVAEKALPGEVNEAQGNAVDSNPGEQPGR
jgi:hypothetical protein